MNSYIYSFESNFISSPDSRPIVLYGLGKQTEEILSQCTDERIIGLLDGFREEGSFCGKPILALQDLVGMTVKIVIVARAASEKIIYKRICGFCQENDIKVYNVFGDELGVPKASREHPYYSKNKQELLELAAIHDFISFDIFDTLLTRKISDRETLYGMVGKRCNGPADFARIRLAAEFELSATGCPTLREIYERVQEKCKCSEDEIVRLMETELSLELWNLAPREELVQVMQSLIASGKQVYLISDMYFSKVDLTKILENCGVTGYQELFVSCEYGVNKANGLFDVYREAVGGNSHLHVGDSEEADVDSPRRYGIDTYLIKSSVDMAELTELGELLTDEPSKEIIWNLLFSQLFRSPFAMAESAGRVHVRDYHAVGYALLGPVVAGFTQWLLERVQDSQMDKLCFVSRDGYLLKQVYELFASEKKDVPEAIYLETSRRLNVVAALETMEDVVWAWQFPFAGTARDRLVRQFGIPEKELLPEKPREREEDYIQRHAAILLQHAAKVRENYRKYLGRFELQDGRVGLFDFVSTGTCQLGLEKQLGFALQGFYFEKLDSEDVRKHGLNIQAYKNEIMPEEVLQHYFLLENWIKEVKASVKEVSDRGEIVRCKSTMEPEQVTAIQSIQNGAMEFCRDLVTMAEWGMDTDVQNLAFKLLRYVNEDVFFLEEMDWPIFDEFTGRRI